MIPESLHALAMGSLTHVSTQPWSSLFHVPAQIVEYQALSSNGNYRTGQSVTQDGSSWASIIDVDNTLGKVYNSVTADYISVTSTGTVTAFQVGLST